MQCSHCGKQIESNEIAFNNHFFCNNLCRYSWQKGNAAQDSGKTSGTSEPQGIFLENLDFEIDLQGLGGKKLLLRSSYLFGMRLFLDDQKLRPVRKQRLKRLRTYIIQDEKGNPVEIKLKSRPFDAIPQLFINGKEHEIAGKFKWYDYIMIALPVVLMYIGGMIGGLFGGAALFTNSILLRKINHKILRYTIININTIMAFIFFFKAIVFIYPYMTDLEFNVSSKSTVISESSGLSSLTRHVWETYKIANLENQDISSLNNPQLGCKRYFFGNGKFSLIMKDGSFFEGKWNAAQDGKFISIKGNIREDIVEIINLSDEELIVRMDNVVFYNRAI